MLSKLIPLALCTIAMVHAVPTHPQNSLSTVFLHSETSESQTDLSVQEKVQQSAKIQPFSNTYLAKLDRNSYKAGPQIDLSLLEKLNLNHYEAVPHVDSFSTQGVNLKNPFRIINAGITGSGAFISSDTAELLVDLTNTDHGTDGWFTADARGGGYYRIRNVGRNAWLGVGRGNVIVAIHEDTIDATLWYLEVEPGTTDIYKISPWGSQQNIVWEGIYDSYSKYGYVILQSPSYGNQDWYFSNK